ncbi:MAG: phage tail protein [Lachnospiraceae bacterium]|nr:phage tail protein [Lachnospiraceae bacterium]
MADNFGLKIGLEGEKEFKKALSDINSSFKVLGSEMKLVESQFGKNDTSVQALTARNTVLNKEIEAQKQKIETLRSALENAASSFGENDKRTQAWQIQLNNAEAALNNMEREVSDTEKAIDAMSDEMGNAENAADKLGDEVEETGKQSDEAVGKFEKFGSVMKSVGKALAVTMAAIGTAAVAAGKGLWDMANDVAEAGDAIDKTSQKIGISAESYQEWDYVFQRCGADVNNLQTGMKKLSGVITDAAGGSDSAAQKLSAVGLSIEDLNGKSQDEQLSIVISALQDMESGAARTAAANDLLGKSAVDMAAVLNMSAEETEALKQEAQDYGMVMSNEAVAASAAFEDSLTRLQGTMGGLKNRMVGELLPGITEILDGLSDLVAGNEQAGEELTNGVTAVIETVTEMIPQAVELISLIAAAILESAPSIISALAEGIINAIPTLLPVILQVITELVTALLELLPQIVNAGMQIIASLITGIATALPTLIPQIVEIIVQIVQTLIDNLPLILDAALQLITGLAEGILNAIPVLIDALPEVILSIVDFLLNSIPQIIDTGIKLLTSLVEALPEIITAIVEAIPKIIDGIITAVIDAIPLIIEAGIKLLVSLIQALPQIITTIVAAIPKIVSGLVDAILGNLDKIIMAGVDLFVALIENLPTIIVEIVKAVPQIIAGIVKAFGSLMGKIVEIGGNIVKGLWDGITGLASWLWDKVSGWISGIWDGICDFFGIHSPSREMAWVGEMLVKGLSGSIEDNGDEAVKAAEGMAADIDGVMNDLAHDMQTALPTDFDVTGNIRSAVDGASGFSGFTIALNIATFNNYSSEDIRQLTNEVMETANQFAMRKGVVFA